MSIDINSKIEYNICGGVFMAYKTIGFVESDKELIEKIDKYRNETNLSFVGAIRKLCADALDFKRIIK